VSGRERYFQFQLLQTSAQCRTAQHKPLPSNAAKHRWVHFAMNWGAALAIGAQLYACACPKPGMADLPHLQSLHKGVVWCF